MFESLLRKARRSKKLLFLKLNEKPRMIQESSLPHQAVDEDAFEKISNVTIAKEA